MGAGVGEETLVPMTFLAPAMFSCCLRLGGLDRLERKTIGMTHHQYLSGASNTNYNAMTISSTSFTIARDEVRTGDARARRVKKYSFEVRDELCRQQRISPTLPAFQTHRNIHGNVQLGKCLKNSSSGSEHKRFFIRRRCAWMFALIE